MRRAGPLHDGAAPRQEEGAPQTAGRTAPGPARAAPTRVRLCVELLQHGGQQLERDVVLPVLQGLEDVREPGAVQGLVAAVEGGEWIQLACRGPCAASGSGREEGRRWPGRDRGGGPAARPIVPVPAHRTRQSVAQLSGAVTKPSTSPSVGSRSSASSTPSKARTKAATAAGREASGTAGSAAAARR